MGKRYFSNIIKGIFTFFNRLRLFLINIIFWGIILSTAVFISKGGIIPDINKNTVLKIHLNGVISEQHTGGYQTELEGLILDSGEILLRDIKEVLDYASADARITSLFLDLSGFSGGGFAKLQEIGQSLQKFKDSGKRIICYSDTFSNNSYYLASYADKIVLDPIGEVRLRGFSSYKNYYRKGLDKFSIKMNIFKAGDFKSAVDPYLLEGMSENDRTAVSALFQRIMTLYTDEVSARRNLSSKKIYNYISNYHTYLKKAEGDSAQAALSYNIVDSVGDYESASSLLDEIEEIEWNDYLKAAIKGRSSYEDKIAVITASGTIMDGDFEPGKIGSETFERLFKAASDNNAVKAVVFRVDSGGGSATASEKIRRAVIQLREKGKPVVVSMSSAAASGGYWISADSDMIISYPSTITGSIGVFAVLPDFSDFLEKYPGITVDGYSSLDSPEHYRPDMPLDKREKEIIQLGVDSTYRKFIDIVSGGRKIPASDLLKIAGGRIWSGIDAVENGLVDKTGYFDDAVKEAALLAGISEYSLVFMDPEEDWKTAAVRELAVLIRMIKSSGFKSVTGFLNIFPAPEHYMNEAINLVEPGRFYSWSIPDTL